MCHRCGEPAFAHDPEHGVELCLHHTLSAILRIMRMERAGWIERGSIKLRLLDPVPVPA